jgi:hypothetical protein
VLDLGFRVKGLGPGVWSPGFWGLRFGFRFRVLGLGLSLGT